MKRLILTICTLWLAFATSFAQTTATNFIGNDCSGTPHNLFTELDGGKIIVLAFVMPCGGCIEPSQHTQSVVQSYNATHPGKVVMYLVDDDALTPCPSLTSWRNSNGLGVMPTFSDPAFVQTQYGTPGMPKMVVLGGTGHSVYFNQNNTIDTIQLRTAINAAINAGTPSSVRHYFKEEVHLSLFPNPAKDRIAINYNLPATADVKISIYNLIGVKVKTIIKEHQPAGPNTADIFLDKLNNGIYFIKLNVAGSEYTAKFTVAN